MGSKSYERVIIEGMEPDPAFDAEVWSGEQVQRLLNTALLGHHASEVPRRLGADATPAQLGADKRFAKKLKNVCIGIVAGQWRISDAPDLFADYLAKNPELMRKEGAQADWAAWLPEHTAAVRSAAEYGCTQLHLQKDFKAANRMLHRLEQEVAQLQNLYNRVLKAQDLP